MRFASAVRNETDDGGENVLTEIMCSLMCSHALEVCVLVVGGVHWQCANVNIDRGEGKRQEGFGKGMVLNKGWQHHTWQLHPCGYRG